MRPSYDKAMTILSPKLLEAAGVGERQRHQVSRWQGTQPAAGAGLFAEDGLLVRKEIGGRPQEQWDWVPAMAAHGYWRGMIASDR
jgi:hypothetical protein